MSISKDGTIKRSVNKHGNAEFWATSNLDMTIEACADYALEAWQIEVYHRDLKQFTGVETGSLSLGQGAAKSYWLGHSRLRSFGVEPHQDGSFFVRAEASHFCDALHAYLLQPHIILPPIA